MNLNQLRAALAKYRLWIAGGAAAVIGYTAYRNVAVSRSTPVALSGASGAEALAAAEQGGDLALRGVALGLGPTEAAIGLGQVALGVVGGALGDLSGLAGQLGGVLGNVTETLIENPPAASPPPPAPAPEPAPSPTETFVGYEVFVQTGQIAMYVVGPEGNLSGPPETWRYGQFSAPSWAPVTRELSGGRLHWRTSAGGYTGWSYVPGSSTPLSLWSIAKHFRRADGTDRWETIGQAGS